jgi:hypothetical protein
MGDIPNENLKLRDLTLPSSHDAGVSEAVHDWKGFPVGKTRYVCQDVDIAGQLACGSRFFDVRFDVHNSAAQTVHETAGVGGWGETADSIFEAIDAHLHANRGEIVIVRVSHTSASAAREVVRSQVRKLRTAYTYKSAVKKNLSKEAIKDLRGKAIIAYAGDAIETPDWTAGQVRFGKASKASREGIVTCGEYPNSSDMKIIRYKAIKRLNEHRQVGGATCCDSETDDHLFMLYWQMTGGNISENTKAGGNPPTLANEAFNASHGTHYNLSHLLCLLEGGYVGKVVHEHTFTDSVQTVPGIDDDRYKWAPNIINLDFVNNEVCNAVIEFNERKLKAAGLWNAGG